ncbi:hypothetical protein ABCR94_02295 [Streptomyces sp. 21So2-11]|uniref:hypothetical protein n=1 Tax=Streptomyces sp. 21So2-11 TaxID=3144408 RepID=UPI00321B5074
MGHRFVTQNLEDTERGAEGKSEDGEDAEGAADLLALLCLDEPAVVCGFCQDLGEADR